MTEPEWKEVRTAYKELDMALVSGLPELNSRDRHSICIRCISNLWAIDEFDRSFAAKKWLMKGELLGTPEENKLALKYNQEITPKINEIVTLVRKIL